jgi:hypothetical protein
MRGLLMALFAFDFPGHGAGIARARPLTAAKAKTTKTTVTTV